MPHYTTEQLDQIEREQREDCKTWDNFALLERLVSMARNRDDAAHRGNVDAEYFYMACYHAAKAELRDRLGPGGGE